MSAPFLLWLFDSIYLIALSAWVGGIAFFSFAVAPIGREAMESQAWAKLANALFPRYYLWVAVAGAAALPCGVATALSFPEMRGPRVGIQAMVILGATLTMLYLANVLSPALQAARLRGTAGETRFQSLRRRSVILNALVLCVGVGLLVAFAARPQPRGEGIREMTPKERAKAIQDRLEKNAEAADRRNLGP